jgi:hypothetical protein
MKFSCQTAHQFVTRLGSDYIEKKCHRMTLLHMVLLLVIVGIEDGYQVLSVNIFWTDSNKINHNSWSPSEIKFSKLHIECEFYQFYQCENQTVPVHIEN